MSNDIVEEIRKVVKLYDRKGLKIGLCPFHLETEPSLIVDPKDQTFTCLSCGKHGGLKTFQSLYYHIPLEALLEGEKEEKQFDQTIADVNKAAAEYYNWRLKSQYGEKCLRYFTNRGLTEGTIDQFLLGVSCSYGDHLVKTLEKRGFDEEAILRAGLALQKDDGSVVDRFYNRAMFPLPDEDGNILGFTGRALDKEAEERAKYVNTPETKVFHKRKMLYGMEAAKQSSKSYFILVEGNMDVISMHQAGFTNTVASCGTALTRDQCQLMKQYKERVIVMYDSDEAGVTSTKKAISLLRDAGLSVTVASLSPFKDPDELIKGKGKEEMVARIKNVINFRTFLVRNDDPEAAIRMLIQNVSLEDLKKYVG